MINSQSNFTTGNNPDEKTAPIKLYKPIRNEQSRIDLSDRESLVSKSSQGGLQSSAQPKPDQVVFTNHLDFKDFKKRVYGPSSQDVSSAISSSDINSIENIPFLVSKNSAPELQKLIGDQKLP